MTSKWLNYCSIKQTEQSRGSLTAPHWVCGQDLKALGQRGLLGVLLFAVFMQMCHTEMEGKIKPACQRHWAKETSSVPILLEPGADDRLQLMGGENDGSHHHHKALPDSSINGF